MEDELKDRKKKNPCRLVESIRSGPESVRIPRDREYGVVLEGGGAKGAFQIGAWRALSEAGIRIGGISGVSVGALNGALMCMGDLDLAEKLWGTLGYSQILGREPESGSLKETAGEFRRLFRERGIDTAPLKRLIRETIDENKIRTSPRELFVTTFSLSDMELMKKDVKTLPEGEIPDILMASAYFPVFKQERLGGKYYMDGGGFNNVPADVLLERGYRDIIIIRIYGPGLDTEKRLRIPEGTCVYHIAPREDLGGVLEFGRKRLRKSLALGYLEGCRLLYGLAGRRYYIQAPHSEAYYFDRMMTELDFYKSYLESVLEPDAAASITQYRFCTETLFPGLALRLGLSQSWDYRALYIALLEELAATAGILRYHIYTDDELSLEVKRSLQKSAAAPLIRRAVQE